MIRYVNCGEVSVELTLLGLAHTGKDRLLSMAKSSRKSKFHIFAVFSKKALLRGGHRVIRELTLSINNKDQLRDLYNYLNQREITAISNLDGCTLGDNLVRGNKRKF